MANANKAKGMKFEREVRRYLREEGIDAFKPYEEGYADAGDIHGIDPFVGQAKDWRSWQDAIREGLDGGERQKLVAGQPFAVAIVKRARRTVAEAYVVMTLATFAAILRRLRGLPPADDIPDA